MTIVQREKKASGEISFRVKEKGKQANDLFKGTDKGEQHQIVKNQRAIRLQG